MAAESLRHVRIKQEMWVALRNAVAAGGLPCEVLMDGATVLVDDLTCYVPDVTIACGKRGEDSALVVPEPLLVVEVVSKSSSGRDAGAKLTGYFRVPSIVHYLLVEMHKPVIVHHRRLPDDTIETRIVSEGRHFEPGPSWPQHRSRRLFSARGLRRSGREHCSRPVRKVVTRPRRFRR